jgi:hypothetical protein
VLKLRRSKKRLLNLTEMMIPTIGRMVREVKEVGTTLAVVVKKKALINTAVLRRLTLLDEAKLTQTFAFDVKKL